MSQITEAPISNPISDLETDSLIGVFADGVRLVGTVCHDCGTKMIGTRAVCSTCVSRDVSRTALPSIGVLYSFTRLHLKAEGTVTMGYIDLPNGVRTLADIRENDIPLTPDLQVELGIDGNDWFFTPVTAK